MTRATTYLDGSTPRTATSNGEIVGTLPNALVAGLGTAATQNTGTSGATLPFANGANTWLLTQTFTLAPIFSDQAGSRTALGLGTMATQNANAVAITGGTFSGSTVTASGTVTGGSIDVAGANAYGTWNTTVAGNAYLALQSSGATYGLIGSGAALIGGGAATELAIRSGADMLFSASGAVERMRLTTTGLGVTGTIEAAKSLLVTDVYAITAVSTAAQTRTLDLANGAVQTITTNDAFTLDLTGPAGKAGLLMFYVYNSAGTTKAVTFGTGGFGTIAAINVSTNTTRAWRCFWDGTRMTVEDFGGYTGTGDLRPA